MLSLDQLPGAASAQSTPPPSTRLAIAAHIVPFAAWLGLMFALNYSGLPKGWTYALRVALCLALLLGLRPWRWYAAPAIRTWPLAVAVGIGVFIIWVFPEAAGGQSNRLLVQELYLRFAIFPLGSIPETVATSSPYAPEICGWWLTLVRLGGSALVIAVIEEFFWRGFLYRWLIDRDFLKPALNTFDWEALLAAAVLFGFEHNRWLAGIVAGLAYTWLMVRTRDIWAAALAHVVTNFLLGLYVLATASYGFW